jgi:hypothetical protein
MCHHKRIDEVRDWFSGALQRFPYWRWERRSQAVTFPEVKDALCQDYVQGGNRSYPATCLFRVSLSLLIVTAWPVCHQYQVAFPPSKARRAQRVPSSFLALALR